MKRITNLMLGVATVAVLGGVMGRVIVTRRAAHEPAPPAATIAEVHRKDVETIAHPRTDPAMDSVAYATTAPATHRAIGGPPEPRPPVTLVTSSDRTNRGVAPAAVTANQSQPRAGEPLADPWARVALAFVGVDDEAEAYWYQAINDPSLPAHEREDLIEDLNEDGLPDPRHPTEDDLPLIISRLLLIEAAWPDAMDEVNADAFQEAYKDLLNLADVAMGGGEPVR